MCPMTKGAMIRALNRCAMYNRRSSIFPPPKHALGGLALQPRNRRQGVQLVGAILRATAHRMTVMAATIARNRIQDRLRVGLTLIIVKRPGPLQRRRAKVIGVARHRVTSCVTDRAIYAFNSGTGLLARLRASVHCPNRVMACLT